MMCFEPVCEKKRALLLDTDIGPDCDDAGALAVLFALQNRWDFSIPAIINCTSNLCGAGAIDGIARYYGAPRFTIGQYTRRPFLEGHERYNRAVAERFSPAFAAGALQTTEAEEAYIQALRAADDNGLIVVLIGQFNVLADVLRREPALFRRKVHGVVAMAGQYPEGKKGYNIECDIESAQYVFAHIPCPVILSGDEVGRAFETGFAPESNAPENPVWLAYHLWTHGKNIRWSWDLTAVAYAVEGAGEYFGFTAPLEITVCGDGSLAMETHENGRFHFLTLKDPAALQRDLNQILCQKIKKLPC